MLKVHFERFVRKLYKLILYLPPYPLTIIIGMYLRYFSNNYVDGDLNKYRSNILKLTDKINVDKFRITGTGVLHLECNKHLIYYPLGDLSENALDRQFTAWKNIVETELKYFVVPIFKKKLISDGYIYITTRLNKCESINKSKGLLKLLRKHGYRGNIEEVFYNKWKESLNIIHIEVPFWQERAQNIFSNKWHVGPCHCDFHIDNVMSLNGNPIMIDLDRFSWKAPQVLDWLHFNVIFDCKTNNINWLQWLEINLNRSLAEIFSHMHIPNRLIKNNNKYDILDLYFLSRLTWELRGRDSFRYKKTLRDIEEYSIKRILHGKD